MDIDVLYSFMLSCLNIYTHVSVCIDYCYRGDAFQTVKHCVLCDIFGLMKIILLLGHCWVFILHCIKSSGKY